jgi:hypothetical protein
MPGKILQYVYLVQRRPRLQKPCPGRGESVPVSKLYVEDTFQSR